VPPAAAQSRSQAWAALPLSVAGRVAGALLWTFDAPRRFAAEDRGLMEAVARQAAQAMERARLRDAERRARAEAEEANRAKSEFLARMSHDLRTPLNAIAGYAQLVEMGVHGPVTEGQREAMSRISRAQSHLLALINDILSFARLEAGQVQFEVTDVPLAEALADVAALVEPQAAAKGLAFVPPPALPGVRVRADRERLQQVLGNLLGNAVKFTPPGGVVTVDAAATPERVTVAVRDTGIGIDPAKLAAIFEPFVQLGGEPAERQGSLGLGLAISRELVRAMGGTITAESRLGDGAAFTVSLARADAPQLPNAR
jgi:signal transduction histidine kinase